MNEWMSKRIHFRKKKKMKIVKTQHCTKSTNENNYTLVQTRNKNQFFRLLFLLFALCAFKRASKRNWVLLQSHEIYLKRKKNTHTYIYTKQMKQHSFVYSHDFLSHFPTHLTLSVCILLVMLLLLPLLLLFLCVLFM